MPDSKNITSPFTVIGNGRSGTSLVSRLLNLHSECMFAGETVNLIHSVWKSMQCSLPESKHAEIPDAIRLHFLKFFPSTTRCWMHKPIGIPVVWHMFPDEDTFYSWFWDVLNQVFPESTYFTVLRHPLDVIASSHQWWGRSLESIIESNRRVARLITHEKSLVNYAVNYHDLIREPESQTRALLEYLKLPFEENCLDAFNVAHVTTHPGDPNDAVSLIARRDQSFSHREKWHSIGAHRLNEEFRRATDACWGKFGFDFAGWPPELVNPS